MRCNLVSPGSTDTDMQRTLWSATMQSSSGSAASASSLSSASRWVKIARPQEIANTILFLASSHASHITLQDIVVDGGSTLGA